MRILFIGFAAAASLFGQHHFSWQDACFKNPAAPYCAGHDFAIKPTKDGAVARSSVAPLEVLPTTIDAAGIDWRFADPSADALAVLDCRKLSGSSLAHNFIGQLGAEQGLSQSDVETIFRGLSAVDRVALSLRDDRVVLMVTGRSNDSVLLAPGTGWKATSLEGNAVLIGHIDAVDQAAQRIAKFSQLSELANMALERPADSDFWTAGSARLAGQEALKAGVKRFSLTVLLRDRLTSETAFEFDAIPDASAIQTWLKTLGNAKVAGNAVHSSMEMDTGEALRNSGAIATSLVGQRLGVLIKSARYLPVRESATTVHTRPVIFGLDDGGREVQHFEPTAPSSATTSSPAQAVTDLSGVWSFTHAGARFQGTIVLRQTGSFFTGTWHTREGKSEPDTSIAGRVDGNIVSFTRAVGNNQTFVLTLSVDGNRLDGFGNGFFLNHTNLTMQRASGVVPSGIAKR